MKQKSLSQLLKNDHLDHFLILQQVEIKTARTGKEYMNLELRDKSTSLPAKIWDNLDRYRSNLKEGSVVKVKGIIEEFSGQLQIRIDEISQADKNEVSITDLMPKSRRDLDEMKKELGDRIGKISDFNLKKLVIDILDEGTYEKFVYVPAGKAWHHAYIHGLLEHTLEIIKICDLICDFHPELNRDLMTAAAILHDIGKTQELEYESGFKYTDKGRLIGHIVIAAVEIEKKTAKMENFPEALKEELLHLVLSHQGKLEQASPVVPKTPEAIALYHADELSAKTNAYLNVINSEIGGETNWTKFIHLANTQLYISPRDSGDFKSTLFDK
jgi:3'-5' exoribonuclease